MKKRPKREIDHLALLKSKLTLLSSLSIKAPRIRRVVSANSLKGLLRMDESVVTLCLKIFPDISKLERDSVLTYNTPELNSKCKTIIEHLNVCMTKLGLINYSISPNIMTEDILKLTIICLNQCNQHIVTQLDNDLITIHKKSTLKSLDVISSLLLIWLEDKTNLVISERYHLVILKILNATIKAIHDYLNKGANIKDSSLLSYILYYQHQNLTILIALNEKEKIPSIDFFKKCLELFESSIQDSLNKPLNEIYEHQLGKNECWINGNRSNTKISTVLNKKKFSIIQLGDEVGYPRFSLRYLCLYCMARQVKSSNIISLKERALEQIAVVLKYELEQLKSLLTTKGVDNLTKAEIILNETLTCLNIIRNTLSSLNDPFTLLYKYGYGDFLIPLLDNYIGVVLKFKLMKVCNEINNVKGGFVEVDDTISYEIAHDYVSGAFLLISKLKKFKEPVSYGKLASDGQKSSIISILTLIEEFIGKYIEIEEDNSELKLIRTYIIEYLFNNRNIVTRQTAEYIMKIIKSASFHFTAPEKLSDISKSTKSECLTNRRIILLLKAVIEDNKIWAETILDHLIKLIMKYTNNEESLFGLYRLIYCALTGESNDNISFSEKILNTDYNTMNYALFMKYSQIASSKAVTGFIDIKGINEIFGILKTMFDNKDRNDKILRMTMNLFIELLNIPLISEQLLSKSFSIPLGEFLKIINTWGISMTIIGKLLSTIKYNQNIIESDKNNYLPSISIESIVDDIRANRLESALPRMELIVNFISQEFEAPSIAIHQELIVKNINLEEFVEIIKGITNAEMVGKTISFFLKLLGGLQSCNEKVTAIISTPNLIKKKLRRLIKQKLQQGMLKSSDIESILRLLLCIIFEIPIDFTQDKRILIIRKDFLPIYLSILLYLSKCSVWNDVAIFNCKGFCKSIEGSYWNYSICRASSIFKRLLKLCKHYAKNPNLLKILINLCKNIIVNCGSSKCIKGFIGLLNTFPDKEINYEDLYNNIMSFLVILLSMKLHCEIFVFSGKPESGLGLLTQNSLPKAGFCFCGSIRVERANQAEKEKRKKMTIFQLGASRTKELEFFVRDGYLNYRISDAKGQEWDNITTFSRKLEEDTWYFIELYHFNVASEKNLMLYINSSFSQAVSVSMYPYKLAYDENTIGCGVQLEYVGKQGEERIIDNFCGEMSALYFIEASNTSVETIHNFLSSAVINSRLENIIEYAEILQNSKMKTSIETNIIEEIFMNINPKYTTKLIPYKQNMYQTKINDKILDIHNAIERVYHATIINHNIAADDIFLNIGGLKTILPVFHNLAKHQATAELRYILQQQFSNFVVEKFLELLDLSVRSNSERVIMFLESNEGLITLRHLFEQLARVVEFEAKIFNRLSTLIYIVIDYYPKLAEPLLEQIVLNPLIWHLSSIELQCELIKIINDLIILDISKFKIDKLIDIFMNAIEIYIIIDPNKYKAPISKLWDACLGYLEKKINYKNLKTLMGYANLWYIRQFPNYPALLLYTLKMLLGLYLKQPLVLTKEIVNIVKTKRDTRILSTLLIILVYLLHYMDMKDKSIADYFFKNKPSKVYANEDLNTEERHSSKMRWIESPNIEDKKILEEVEKLISNSKSDTGFEDKKTLKKSVNEIQLKGKDEILIRYCNTKRAVIDKIMGICIYILLDFDWNALINLSKSFVKNEPLSHNPSLKQSESLIEFIIKIVPRLKERVELYLVKSIFYQRECTANRSLGKSSFKALIAVALDNSQEIADEFGLKPMKYKNNTSKLKSLLTFILRQAIQRFDEKANLKLIEVIKNNEELIKEIIASNEASKLMLNLSQATEDKQLIKIQAHLICSKISPSHPHLWNHLLGSLNHKLRVLDETLNITQITLKKNYDIMSCLKCIEFSYALEDIFEAYSYNKEINEAFFNDNTAQNIVKVLGKLVLYINKANFLYSSMPICTTIETRPIQPDDKGDYEREGGILRILLKLTFLCIKGKLNIGYSLFRYLLFKNANDKADIKNYIGVYNVKVDKGTSKKLNLMEIMKGHKEAMKQLKTMNSFCIKQVIGGRISIMSKVKIKESTSSLLKEMNLFDDSKSLIVYIFTSILQLIYFELFDTGHIGFPHGEFNLTKIMIQYLKGEKKLSENYMKLVKLLKDTFKHNTEDIALTKLVEGMKSSMKYYVKKLKTVPYFEPNLDNVYTSLDSKTKLIKEMEESKISESSWKKLLESFIPKWEIFWNTFLSLMTTDSSVEWIDGSFLNLLLQAQNLFSVYPILLLMTSHTLNKLEYCIFARAISDDKTYLNETKIGQDVIEKIWKTFPRMKLPKYKLKRDELKKNIDSIGKSYSNKLLDEQYSKIGCWYNPTQDINKTSLFNYIEKQYNKLLKKCSSYNNERSKTFNEFVKLSISKDGLNISRRLKRLKKPEVSIRYKYLRLFILKKMMISTLSHIDIKQLDYYETDFKYKLLQDLFVDKKKCLANIMNLKKEMNLSKCKVLRDDDNGSERSVSSIGDYLDSYEYIPISVKYYDTELITVKGAIFGRLTMNSSYLSFHSIPRNQCDEYKLGATETNQLNEVKMFKMWDMEEIKEFVVKRYNLMRQAIEIYFHDKKSVLLSFFKPRYLSKFFTDLRYLLIKGKQLGMEIVDNPEKYFFDKGFTDMWTKDSLSNFEYLMILNKYSGRSFNDLSQYPVFPWVLTSFNSPTINLLNNKSYRRLDTTIAGINANKKTSIVKRVSELSKTHKTQYQFEIHYLTPRTVFDYLTRLHPYSSLVSKYGLYSTNVFYDIRDTWKHCNNDIDDNKELIPEFYYLPEMLNNYNLYSLGLKENLLEKSDQVKLPAWAKNNHQFIQFNAMALESLVVSSELHEWFDLVFGVNQQDRKRNNMFNPLCDETTLRESKVLMTESLLADMQESGVNPIRLFKEKHSQRNIQVIQKKLEYSIFDYYEDDTSIGKVLLKTDTLEENQPIVYIESFENKVLVVVNSQKLYKTKEKLINHPYSNDISFITTPITLFPFTPSYDNIEEIHKCDAQRCFVVLDNGNHILSCRHYDCSWKISACSNGIVEESFYFHKTTINCICTNEDKTKVFTGSNDGVIAMWIRNSKSFSRPRWYGHNHDTKLISLDVSERLGLVVTAGVDGTIVLRKISNGKLVRVIGVPMIYKNQPFIVSHVRLSYRGYIIIIAKSQVEDSKEYDIAYTYSINGELVDKRQLEEFVNGIILGESGYELIIGGKSGVLFKYNITNLCENYIGANVAAKQIAKESFNITALNLTMQKGCQRILIGTSQGGFYVYKIDMQKVANKIIEVIPGLM